MARHNHGKEAQVEEAQVEEAQVEEAQKTLTRAEQEAEYIRLGLPEAARHAALDAIYGKSRARTWTDAQVDAVRSMTAGMTKEDFDVAAAALYAKSNPSRKGGVANSRIAIISLPEALRQFGLLEVTDATSKDPAYRLTDLGKYASGLLTLDDFLKTL